MRIAVIPARGGSKRIPRKNVKDFCGKPMMAWSIEAALTAECFDRVLVSTDDPEISAVARSCGVEAPFVRPPELSNDHATTADVMAHATQWATTQGWKPTSVCCIYATAPLLEPEDLLKGLRFLESGLWQYAFSATDFAAPIFRSFRELPDGGVEMLYPEYMLTRSQDLPETLHDAGQFYWGRPEAWLERKAIFARHSVPVRIPRWRVQDIDTNDDWIRAELIKRQIEAGE